MDRREDNGEQKLTEWYLGHLHELVSGQPTDYGERRPTWTRELLVKVMARRTGMWIHVTTMSRALLDNLPDDEVAVYEDEVDIHLNPKIGLDSMNRGQQKEVVTPGGNEKRYLAGAMNAKTRLLTVNFRIHDSKITRQSLALYNGRIVLHFLPPYCPNENKIERLWRDLHSEVTRNHNCKNMQELMRNVRYFIRRRAVRPSLRIRKLAA